MKNNSFITLLLLLTGIVLLSFFASWWAASVWIVVITSIMKISPKQGIFLGSFSLGIVWLAMAFYMSLHDQGLIISKTGALLGGLSVPLMIMVTAIIALITGTLAGWLGSAIGISFRPQHLEKN